jgi:hypothetical protein
VRRREPIEPSVVGRLTPELGDPHRRRVPTRHRGRSGATLTLMLSLSVAVVALAALAGANRDGGLRSADGLSQGSAFIASLQRFLIKYGYAS